MELLRGGRVGRLVYNSRYGLVALPVEYKLLDGAIVFVTWDNFTEEDLRTGIAHAEYQVAVEADQVDLESREGWIVLVRGAAHHLDTEAERSLVVDSAAGSWVDGDESQHFIRVNPITVWGNRVRRA